jgi:hypothetical protein
MFWVLLSCITNNFILPSCGNLVTGNNVSTPKHSVFVTVLYVSAGIKLLGDEANAGGCLIAAAVSR